MDARDKLRCKICQIAKGYAYEYKYGIKCHIEEGICSYATLLFVEELSSNCDVPRELQCKIEEAAEDITASDPTLTGSYSCSLTYADLTPAVSCTAPTLTVIL